MPKRRQNKRFKSNSNLIDFQLKVNQIKPPTLLFFNPFILCIVAKEIIIDFFWDRNITLKSLNLLLSVAAVFAVY